MFNKKIIALAFMLMLTSYPAIADRGGRGNGGADQGGIEGLPGNFGIPPGQIIRQTVPPITPIPPGQIIRQTVPPVKPIPPGQIIRQTVPPVKIKKHY